MEPNDKDLAEFARLGLYFHLLAPSAIVAWADGMVASEDNPPLWVIDLSLARSDDVVEALKRVPGDAQGDLSTRLFLALVRHRWGAGSLTIGDVRGIGWRLHIESMLPTPDKYADWGACLEVEGDDLDAGWRTEADLRESIDEKLAQYADLEPMLPDWA